MPDRRRLVGAVNAIDGRTEIHRARAQRIARPAGHEARQIRLALDHFRRWMPVRPLGLAADLLHAGPGEAIAADADAVADRAVVAEHVIKIRVRRIDDDGAGRLLGDEIHLLPAQVRRQLVFTALIGLGLLIRRQRRHRGRAAIGAHGSRRLRLDGSGGRATGRGDCARRTRRIIGRAGLAVAGIVRRHHRTLRCGTLRRTARIDRSGIRPAIARIVRRHDRAGRRQPGRIVPAGRLIVIDRIVVRHAVHRVRPVVVGRRPRRCGRGINRTRRPRIALRLRKRGSRCTNRDGRKNRENAFDHHRPCISRSEHWIVNGHIAQDSGAFKTILTQSPGIWSYFRDRGEA